MRAIGSVAVLVIVVIATEAVGASAPIWSFSWLGEVAGVQGELPQAVAIRAVAEPNGPRMAFLSEDGQIDSVVALGAVASFRSFVFPDGMAYGLTGRLQENGQVEVSGRQVSGPLQLEGPIGDAMVLSPGGRWLAGLDHRYDELIVADSLFTVHRLQLQQPQGLRFSPRGGFLACTSRTFSGPRLSVYRADGERAWTGVIRTRKHLWIEAVSEAGEVAFTLERQDERLVGLADSRSGVCWVDSIESRPIAVAVSSMDSMIVLLLRSQGSLRAEVRKSMTGETTATFQLPTDSQGWTSVTSILDEGRFAVAALTHGETDRVEFIVAMVPDRQLEMIDGFSVPRDETTWFANKVHLVPQGDEWITLRAPGTVRVYRW